MINIGSSLCVNLHVHLFTFLSNDKSPMFMHRLSSNLAGRLVEPEPLSSLNLKPILVTVCGLWLLQTLSLCVSLSVCTCVCLSRFYRLHLATYGSDFDQTWWKCWNFGSIDCIKISWKLVLSWGNTMMSFLIFKVISKGNNSVQRETITLHETVTPATAILYY